MTSVLEAIALIDSVIGEPTREQVAREQLRRERAHLTSLGLLPHEMGGIATKGCRKCGKTMYRTQERSGGSQWVCSSCGAVE
jgi:formylmethanofuran dehydrogenase subunit E